MTSELPLSSGALELIRCCGETVVLNYSDL